MSEITDERLAQFAADNGYAAYKRTATGFAFLGKMAFNWRISVGTLMSVDDSYCYDEYDVALNALQEWDGLTGEPTGWKRHVQSGRRRPGGDASQEYISL